MYENITPGTIVTTPIVMANQDGMALVGPESHTVSMRDRCTTRRVPGEPVGFTSRCVVLLAVLGTACAAAGKPSAVAYAPPVVKPSGSEDNPRVLAVERGKAVWYGAKFHGRKTASGERFNKDAMTAAHKTLPFGTVVRVTNLRNNRSVRVRINDRGPYGKGRMIDLAEAAARKLGMIGIGVIPAKLEVLKYGPKKKKNQKKRKKQKQGT